MTRDVFISHSTLDKPVADAVCAALESHAIRCWIAPRDVQPGRSFAGEIARAIQNSRAMVLVFSAHANSSDQVLREVQLAANAHHHIVQFRIEDVLPNDDLSYFLSTPHWLDALTPPLEIHLQRLTAAVKTLLTPPLDKSAQKTGANFAKDSARHLRGTSEVAHAAGLSEHPTSSLAQESQPQSEIARERLKTLLGKRKKVLASALMTLLVIGAAGGWWFGIEHPRKEAERQRRVNGQWAKEKQDKEATRRREMGEQQYLESERKAKPDVDAENLRLAAEQRARDEEAKKKEISPKAAAQASRERPYENSLGMKFVPVDGVGVLFCIWETRVKDYKLFVEATKREWQPGFMQTEGHPAVNVSWEDTTAFCEWLTESERKTGMIAARQSYRLPTDLEWSAAVALEKEGGATPKERDMKVKGVYPWGTKWPPPKDRGNYDPSLNVDDYRETSPTGSFEANRYRIHDLGGNVWEWCQDWYDAEKKYRTLRGASWDTELPGAMLSSCRGYVTSERRDDDLGFRCVLVVESSR